MNQPQAGILQAVPNHARYLAFSISHAERIADALRDLVPLVDGEQVVVGFGQSLATALKANVAGLKPFPQLTAPGLTIASAPEAVWVWLRGDDRGDILHRSRRITRALAPAFTLDDCRDAFKHDSGRDLSGYEDGTENPVEEAAVEAALVGADQPTLTGSSFVAVQRWQHNFDAFDAMSEHAQNHAIGRRRSDNEELDDAPESAHVKRTAQESFTPEAFIVRRSMPWADGNAGGLVFVAFGQSFAAFEAQLKRMTGGEDGTVDALFGFTQPLTGGYYWCPAMKDGRLDLAPLGL